MVSLYAIFGSEESSVLYIEEIIVVNKFCTKVLNI